MNKKPDEKDALSIVLKDIKRVNIETKKTLKMNNGIVPNNTSFSDIHTETDSPEKPSPQD